MVLFALIDLLFTPQNSFQGQIKDIWRLKTDTSDKSFETQEDRSDQPSWEIRQSQVDFILWVEVSFSDLLSYLARRWSIINSSPGSSFHGEFTNRFWSLSKFGHSKTEWNQLDELVRMVCLLDIRLALHLHFNFSLHL